MKIFQRHGPIVAAAQEKKGKKSQLTHIDASKSLPYLSLGGSALMLSNVSDA